tara:strand:+ start:86 stop:193 length:108 start_codon:yes stop_codon:yes gene_type:complete
VSATNFPLFLFLFLKDGYFIFNLKHVYSLKDFILN